MPVPMSKPALEHVSFINERSYELARGTGYESTKTRLQAATDLQDATADLIAQLVADARAQGATWSEIAELLGVTRQAASKKYAPTEHLGVTQVPTSQGAAAPRVMPTDQVPKSKLSRQQRRQLDRLDRRKARR